MMAELPKDKSTVRSAFLLEVPLSQTLQRTGEQITVKLKAIMSEVNSVPDLTLNAGDTIIVP